MPDRVAADRSAPGHVRDQYRTTARLRTRSSVWQPNPDGIWPQDVVLSVLAEIRPQRVLDVGCGEGALALRIAAELGADVTGLDSSPAMVRAARAAGLEARLGDAQQLQFPDSGFDAVLAAWMLYHVPDLDLALSELARVLRPGGLLVAVTNGRDHLKELWNMVGAERAPSKFSRENGQEILERRFQDVGRRDLASRAVFADRKAAAGYIATLGRQDLAAKLPQFRQPLVASGTPTVFTARKPS